MGAREKQRGMVLVMTLVLLLILTILASASMEVSTLQERIAGNTRDTTSAFQAAEAAVRNAERYLESATIGPFNGSDGLYEVCSAGASAAACQVPAWRNYDSAGWVAVDNELPHVSKQPQYVIEKYAPVVDPTSALDADRPLEAFEFYRVTARGFGVSDRSMVVLQSTYRRD